MTTTPTERRLAITPGIPKIVSDAQGPMGLMHPTEKGVAICWFSDVFKPVNGFIHHPSAEPEACPEAYLETTYHPERVANVRMVHDAFVTYNACGLTPSELLAKVRELAKAAKSLRMEAVNILSRGKGYAPSWDEHDRFSKCADEVETLLSNLPQ